MHYELLKDMDNMERFDHVVLALFEILVANFPKPVDIVIDKEVHKWEWPKFDSDEETEEGFENFLDLHEVYWHTIHFLHREGIISRIDWNELDRSRVLGCCLTTKGLAITRGIPVSMRERSESNLVEAFRSNALDIGKRAAGGVIGDVVSTLFANAPD